MKPVFKPNPRAVSAFRHALGEIAALTDKDNPEGLQKLLLQSSRRFVKNVAAITPPAQGKADNEAKKRGENKILGDLLKIAQPVAGMPKAQARELLTTAKELVEAHAKSRSARGGVNPRNRKEKALIDQREFVRAVTILQGRVGWLAAGLNAAANKLGFRLPGWIARHGEKYGAIEVTFTERRLRVKVVQNVPYTDNVGGYARKWNFAFEKEVRTVQKMMGVLRDRAFIRARRRFR